MRFLFDPRRHVRLFSKRERVKPVWKAGSECAFQQEFFLCAFRVEYESKVRSLVHILTADSGVLDLMLFCVSISQK